MITLHDDELILGVQEYGQEVTHSAEAGDRIFGLRVEWFAFG